MAKAKGAEKVPAVVEEALPEWFLPEEGEVAYQGKDDAETGGGLPFVSCANPKAGGAGGQTTWADLTAAGCASGDAFAAGGNRGVPLRLAGVPLLLLRSRRVAYITRSENGYKPEGTRQIAEPGEAKPGEKQAFDTLVLVLSDEPFLATYRERLSASIGNRTMVVGPWIDRLASMPDDKLPPFARLAGRIHSEAKASTTSGQTYFAERLRTAPLTAPEIQRLYAWLAGSGRDSHDTVREWEGRFKSSAPAAGPGDPFADAFPEGAEGGGAKR